jgi:PTH1 family peptidyl-tRNA hydrolase
MTEHAPIQIVVGLGNPGDRYEKTRHNAGFWFVDRLARDYGGLFREDRRHQGEVARVRVRGADLLLLKPNTFMNRSGASVRSLAAYLKVPPERVLVAHDELDLPVGTVRLKRGGGPGGHNGLKDVIAHLGREFYRLRIGIGHPREQAEVIDYVLRRPGADEETRITEAIGMAADVLPVMLAEGEQRAMNTLHRPPKPPADDDDASAGS